MTYLFLLPLLIALVAGYLSRRTSDEIAYLTNIVTIISLIVSLILAPWQIQLLLLITIVVIVTLLWQKWEKPAPVTVNSLKNTPEKTDRKASNPETTPETERNGKYRGVPVKITRNPSIAAPVRSSVLKYRGASVVADETNQEE